MRCRFLLPALLLALASGPAPAAVFVVDSNFDNPDQDTGDGLCDSTRGTTCTLRAAIEQANALPGLDYIEFSIGTSTLAPLSPYPAITDDVVIDATTSPDYDDSATDPMQRPPAITLDGFFVSGDTTRGLWIRGTTANPVRAEVRGFSIVNFPGNGIEVASGDLAIIDANWIGLRPAGMAAGNDGHGMVLSGCSGCVVGALVLNFLGADIKLGVGNVISANGGDGLLMGLGTDNVVGGNVIGAAPSGGGGFAAAGNGGNGISLLEAGTRVGMLLGTVDSRNYVLYNAGHGVQAAGSGIVLQSNRVASNGGVGIGLVGSDHKVLSGVVSSNLGGIGIRIGSETASANRAEVRGTQVLRHDYGILARNGSDIVIADTRIDVGYEAGILVQAEGTTIAGNRIFPGIVSPPEPTRVGIQVDGNDARVIGNTIAGVTGRAISVSGDTVKVESNLLGIDATETVLGNGVGVSIDASAQTAEVRFNLVVGAVGDGIVLSSTGALVCGNRIGWLDINTPAGNGLAGVWVPGHDNFIGDYPPAPHYCAGNEIGHSAGPGVEVQGLRNRVASNVITDNQSAGVLLHGGAAQNTVLENAFLDNVLAALLLPNDAGEQNRLERNLFGAGAGDIDLGNDGPTANDFNDNDEGPNRLLNHPEIVAVFGGAGSVDVTSRIDIAPTRASFPVRVDFYFQPEGSDARVPLESDSFELLGPSQLTTTLDLPRDTTAGLLFAVAIDADGNSSELGPGKAFSSIPTGNTVFSNGFED